MVCQKVLRNGRKTEREQINPAIFRRCRGVNIKTAIRVYCQKGKHEGLNCFSCT